MRRVIICSLLLVLLSSCGSNKQLFKVEENRVEENTSSVKYVEVLRDTTIYVPIQSEAQSAIKQDSSHLETSLAKSSAHINEDGTLSHSIENKPQEMAVNVQVKDTETEKVKEVLKIETIVEEIPVPIDPTRLQRVMYISGWVAWAVLMFGVLFKLKGLRRAF